MLSLAAARRQIASRCFVRCVTSSSGAPRRPAEPSRVAATAAAAAEGSPSSPRLAADGKPLVRLYRLRQGATSPANNHRHSSDFRNATNVFKGSFPLFDLHLRIVSRAVLDETNRGPTWMRGAYPAGVLDRKYEERRPINSDRDTRWWRDVSADPSEDARRLKKQENDLARVEPTSAMRPLLVHGSDTRTLEMIRAGGHPTNYPYIVLTTKKRVSRLATGRTRVARMFTHALFVMFEKYRDDIPLYDNQGNVLAICCMPKTDLKEKTKDDVISAREDALASVRRWYRGRQMSARPRNIAGSGDGRDMKQQRTQSRPGDRRGDRWADKQRKRGEGRSSQEISTGRRP